MTKREFLDRLERCLASLDPSERASMVDFYSEQIDDRMDDGMTESQAVASLESPEDIAANILSLRGEASAAATEPPAEREHRGVGYFLKKALLWTCAGIGIVILLPVALGLGAAVLCVYLAFWCVVVALGASALACLVMGVFNVVASFVTPVSGEAALVANLALSAAALGAAILIALGAYFLAKLLVMLVVWTARAIQKRPRQRTVETKSNAYPSMPMPPMDRNTPKQRRPLPGWGILLIAGIVMVVAAGCTVLGAMAAAGGPAQLLAQARTTEDTPAAVFVGTDVDTIDLTTNPQRMGWLPNISVAPSPDANIYVYSNDPRAGGMLYWGEEIQVRGQLESSTLSLSARTEGIFVLQPFISAIESAARINANNVQILVPQNWKGTIVCNEAQSTLQIGAGDGGQTSLRVDGSIAITNAEHVVLDSLEASSIEVAAWRVTGLYVQADTLTVNEGLANGRAWLHDVTTDRLVVGGESVETSNVEAEAIEAAASTRLHEAEVSYDRE